jgi:hypothetical protein
MRPLPMRKGGTRYGLMRKRHMCNERRRAGKRLDESITWEVVPGDTDICDNRRPTVRDNAKEILT